MRYYALNESLNIKDIGDFPQIQDFIKGYDDDRRESCSQVGRHLDKIPDVRMDFNGLMLAKNARLTDYVSSSYLSYITGLLISQRLMEYFSGLNIPDNIVYPVQIYQKDRLLKEEYKWMHFIDSGSHLVNYEASEFFFDGDNPIPVKVSSLKDLKDKEKDSEFYIMPARLVLHKEAAGKLDLIRITRMIFNPVVTEKVKDEMLAKGFSGFTFEPTDMIVLK